MKRKPEKYWLLLVLMPFLQACPPPVPCNPIITNVDPIPDSVRAIIPYANEETYGYVHSAGAVIHFICSRNVEENNQCFDCSECLVFEKLNVTLQPDYLLPPIELSLRQNGESFYEMDIWFGNSSFTLPVNFIENESIAEIFSDTIGIKRDHYNPYNSTNASLYADSIYYVLEKGIVKIVMSNKESYSLYEE